MATFSVDSLLGTTQAFSLAADILSLSGNAAEYSFANDGSGNLVVSKGGSSVTFTGITLAQLTTSNVIFSGSSNLIAGDNTTGTANDDLQQLAGGALDLVSAAGANLDADNLLFGLGEGDIITIGAGNNVVYGGSGGVDTIDGSDTITINGSGSTSGSNRIFGNGGNDTVLFTDPTGAGQHTFVYGGLGADDIVTGAATGNMELFGNGGNDTINAAGATAPIAIYGGDAVSDTADGSDVLTGSLGNCTIFANGGDDVLYYDDFASSSAQIFYAGAGDDTIAGDVGGSGSSGVITLLGNAGSDSIDATSHLGTVIIYGGNGSIDTVDSADTILIGTGNAGHNATVFGNAGNDTITASASLAAGETIVVYGGLGADEITMSGVRDFSSSVTLFGNEGADIYNINDGSLASDATITFGGFAEEDVLNLTLAGGTATDLEVTGLGSSVSINNGAANGNYVFSGFTGNFSSSNFVLSDGSALITNFGTTAAGLTGTANADQLIAGEGGDTLSGAAGADILTGGDGADSIDGGDDIDTITGGEGNDTILAGGGGADDNSADSSIDGGTGSDSIIGGEFEDSIDGGNGNDTIAGGTGDDTITGGSESDTFLYAIAEVDAVDTNVDLIKDAFTGGDVFGFSDLTNDSLRGTGVSFASGNASSAQSLGANVGMYVATNAAGSFSEANIYSALSGIADDLVAADILYVMISDGTDARLVRITEAANAGSLVAADDTLEFVARLEGVSTTDLSGVVAGNFSEFA